MAFKDRFKGKTTVVGKTGEGAMLVPAPGNPTGGAPPSNVNQSASASMSTSQAPAPLPKGKSKSPSRSAASNSSSPQAGFAMPPPGGAMGGAGQPMPMGMPSPMMMQQPMPMPNNNATAPKGGSGVAKSSMGGGAMSAPMPLPGKAPGGKAGGKASSKMPAPMGGMPMAMGGGAAGLPGMPAPMPMMGGANGMMPPTGMAPMGGMPMPGGMMMPPQQQQQTPSPGPVLAKGGKGGKSTSPSRTRGQQQQQQTPQLQQQQAPMMGMMPGMPGMPGLPPPSTGGRSSVPLMGTNSTMGGGMMGMPPPTDDGTQAGAPKYDYQGAMNRSNASGDSPRKQSKPKGEPLKQPPIKFGRRADAGPKKEIPDHLKRPHSMPLEDEKPKNYTPYTMDDWKKVKDAPVKRGGLGPSDTDEQRFYRAMRKKALNYAENNNKINLVLLADQEETGEGKQPLPIQAHMSKETVELQNRRQKAMEFAKGVPKPKTLFPEGEHNLPTGTFGTRAASNKPVAQRGQPREFTKGTGQRGSASEDPSISTQDPLDGTGASHELMIDGSDSRTEKERQLADLESRHARDLAMIDSIKRQLKL